MGYTRCCALQRSGACGSMLPRRPRTWLEIFGRKACGKYVCYPTAGASLERFSIAIAQFA